MARDRYRLSACRRTRQGLVALVVAVVPFVIAVPSAFATLSASVTPSFPSPVTVGQSGLAESLQIQNNSTSPESSGNVTVSSITVVPACGTTSPTAQGDCPVADADPGVFTLSSTAMGVPGTACASTTFTVATIDAATGDVQFTPSSGSVVLTSPGTGNSACTIVFTATVNKMPIHPFSTSGNSSQTVGIAATAYSSSVNGSTGTAFGTQTVTIDKATPAIVTTPSGGATVGGTISDSAVMSGGVNPTGTLTFDVYGPNTACTGTPAFSSTTTVSGNGTYASSTFTPTAAGIYEFVVAYTGDAENAGGTTVCGTELVTVTAPQFTAVTPARDLDTRNGTGGTTGPVAGSSTFNLTVTGVNGVPSTGVGAVALNVTVTSPTCAAWLTVFPAGQPLPSSSNLNYTAGQTIPNLVVVGVGTGGQVSFNVPAACAGTIQVIADIQGWYSAQTGTPPAGSYTPLTPARDLDTRNGTGGTSGPVHGNTTFNLTVTGVNGVPATGAGAVALNVTITSPTCAAWLTVFPAGQPVPSSSNLNYSTGETIPNLVIVAVGSGGKVSFNVPSACAGSVQVIADIQGWYASQTGTPPSGSYTPLTPARDLDTRSGTGGTTGPVHGSTTFNLTVDGVNGVPASGVRAVVLNVTVTNPTCAAWVTVFPAGNALPPSSNLNYTAGETIPNLVVVGVGSAGQVSINVPSACAGTVQILADIQGWYAT